MVKKIWSTPALRPLTSTDQAQGGTKPHKVEKPLPGKRLGQLRYSLS